MKSKRFSATTPVLVVVLLGTVFGVSHLVTAPPTPSPEEAAKAQQEMSPADKARMQQTQNEQAARYRKDLAEQQNTPKPGERAEVRPPNPDEAHVDGTGWNKHMGDDGEKLVGEDYARKKIAWDSYNKRHHSKVASPVPVATPAVGTANPGSAPPVAQ